MNKALTSLTLTAGLLVVPSCAWANPANRPVWNSFEQNLVPEDDGWFYAALPLTVPVGLGAVLIDTFVAHPLQIVDDAIEDAGELWVENDPDFADEYYTEMAYLPLRVTFTPLVFAGSFIGRSLFDIRERTEPLSVAELEQQRAKRQAEEQLAARALFVAWLRAIVRDPAARYRGDRPQWHDSFEQPLQQALQGNALARRALHLEMMGGQQAEFGSYRAELGLRDPDPVVRFAVLSRWPRSQPVVRELVDALENDPNEAVRLAAQRRF